MLRNSGQYFTAGIGVRIRTRELRWPVERTVSWPKEYHPVGIRLERRWDHDGTFVRLACSMIVFQQLVFCSQDLDLPRTVGPPIINEGHPIQPQESRASESLAVKGTSAPQKKYQRVMSMHRNKCPMRAIPGTSFTFRPVINICQLICLMLLMTTGSFAPSIACADHPNIIIIYADDLGYGDLSCYNPRAAYTTPRLDRMAHEGIRFTDAHSPSTICSPSRYGLFSGQQIYRSTGGGGGAFEGPGGPSYLKPGTFTLPQMLKERGYRTGVFGKWHVGLSWFDQDGNRLDGGFDNSLKIDYAKSTPLIDGPNRRGFDESFVTPNCPTTDPLYVYIENGMVHTPASERHVSDSLPNLGGKWRWDNDEGWKSPGYEFVNADLLFLEKTADFIVRHREDHPTKPFFAVLCTQIAHAPVLPAESFRNATNAGPRGDFVRELDTIVGRIFDQLVELEIEDNTLVIFTSDNGPETTHVDWMRRDHGHDSTGGWRGMKRDGWEGGHRVPFLAWWPSRIPAGLVSNQLLNTTDIFATLASAVGFELPDEVAVAQNIVVDSLRMPFTGRDIPKNRWGHWTW